MSAPVVGGDLFRWELAIPGLALDKTGKTGGDVPEILFESRQLHGIMAQPPLHQNCHEVAEISHRVEAVV